MKISKAVEILEDLLRWVEPGDPPDERDATRLGLEALKRHHECKDRTCKGMLMPLPGETPE